MTDLGQRLERALSGTLLGGRAVTAVAVSHSGESGYELDITGLDVLSSWRAALSTCEELGLWPIVCDVSGPDVYGRRVYSGGREPAPSPRTILDQIEGVVWPPSLPDATHYFDREWVEVVRMFANEAAHRVGSAPTEAELLNACPDPDYAALERYVLRWEEVRRPTTSQEPPGRFDEPLLELGSTLVLLPNPDPWAVPAYLDFCYILETDQALLARAMREWHERYRAVPYAATGVTIHFVVERPTVDVFDALEVAAQQLPFCKMDDSLRERARALYNASFWELYNRG
jgi:hypothetical protein